MASWKKLITSGDVNSTGSNASLNFLSINHYVDPTTTTLKLDVSGSGVFGVQNGTAAIFVETSNVLGSFSALENQGLFIESVNKNSQDSNNLGIIVNTDLALYVTGSNSYVGINTDDPTHQFRVSGSLRVDSPGNSPGTQTLGPPDTVEGGPLSQSSPNIYLGTPDKWLVINIDGRDYHFPGYEIP